MKNKDNSNEQVRIQREVRAIKDSDERIEKIRAQFKAGTSNALKEASERIRNHVLDTSKYIFAAADAHEAFTWKSPTPDYFTIRCPICGQLHDRDFAHSCLDKKPHEGTLVTCDNCGIAYDTTITHECPRQIEGPKPLDDLSDN